jgi:CubicO group peptidase (beta-lactamase class C family)
MINQSASALLLLCLPSVASAQEPTRDERLRFLEEQLEEKRIELHIPGFAISVVQGDQMIWARGFGLADVEKERAVAPDTLFAIGSATKAFTATLVGVLVDEHLLEWDAPITDYLPDFRLAIRTDDEKAVVCLRDLLAHRTGFSRGDLLWAGGRADAATILATIVHAEPWAAFRKEFHYNNVMYLAAGETAAKVTKKPWATLMKERLFTPLGMKDTNVSVAESKKDPRLALGYEWDKDTQRFDHKPMRTLDVIGPAGAINSNVVDMAQWLRFQLGRGEFEGKRLISDEAHRETWTKQNGITANDGYGMGWMLHTWKGQPVVEHGGNIDGFGAHVAMLPDSDLGYVLLTNVTATPLQNGSMELVWNAMLGDIAPKEDVATTDRAPYLGTFIANFAAFEDAKMRVLELGGKLAVDVPGQTVYTLKEPDADGKWFFELTDQIAISFERNAKGEVIVLKFHQAGMIFDAPREGIELPAEIDLDDARRYLGKYHDAKLKDDVTVVIRNNRLAVDVPKQMVFELHAPDAEGRRGLRANGALAVRFDENDDGSIRGLTFFKRESERFFPRVASADDTPLISIDALHALCKTDARAAALAAFGTYRLRGKTKMVHAGIEGSMTVVGRGADRWRTTVDFEPFATIETCYDAGFAAMASTLAPYEELDGEALRRVRVEHPLLSLLDWRSCFTKIVVQRADELDDRKVWVVKLALDDDIHVTVWVDAETGDTLREDSSQLLPGGIGNLPITSTLSDFRVVKGLRIPHRIDSENEATGKSEFTLDLVETQLDVPDSAIRIEKPTTDRR